MSAHDSLFDTSPYRSQSRQDERDEEAELERINDFNSDIEALEYAARKILDDEVFQRMVQRRPDLKDYMDSIQQAIDELPERRT